MLALAVILARLSIAIGAAIHQRVYRLLEPVHRRVLI